MTAQVFTSLFVALFILKLMIRLWLDLMNLGHLKKKCRKNPGPLEGFSRFGVIAKNRFLPYCENSLSDRQLQL